MESRELRARARGALRGYWGQLLAIFLAAGLIGCIPDLLEPLCINNAFFSRLLGSVDSDTVRSLLVMIVANLLNIVDQVLKAGRYRVCEARLDGRDADMGMLLRGENLGAVILMNLLRTLLVGLGTLLFIIPGILLNLSYAMADDLMVNDSRLGPVEALRESRERMRGRRGDLFWLELTFIGWVLLTVIAIKLFDRLLLPLTGGSSSYLYTALSAVATMLIMLPLNLYRLTAVTAFFRCVQGRDEDTDDEADSGEAGEEDEFPYDMRESFCAPLNPVLRAGRGIPEGNGVIELNADEVAARDMLEQYSMSRRRMAEDGVLEDYRELHIDPVKEQKWMQAYADRLVQGLDAPEQGLDALLEFATEYARGDLIDRAFSRMERHLREESIGDAEILNAAARLLAAVLSGAFADEPAYVRRKKETAADMADRLEQRLNGRDPDGDWRETLSVLRVMTEET